MKRVLSLATVVVLVVVAGVVFVGQLSTSRPRGAAGFTMATSQSDSPIMILAATSRSGGGFTYVKYRNRSVLPIESVTFGAYIHTVGGTADKALLVPGRAHRVNLAPNATLTTEIRLLSKAALQKLRAQHPGGIVAELGVVAVVNSNGERWVFDRSRNQFALGASTFSVGKPCAPPGIMARAFADDAHYRCTASSNREWCDMGNQGQECTAHVCNEEECPMQKCEYIADR